MSSSLRLFLKVVLEAAIIASVITGSGGRRDASYYLSRWASTNSQAQTKLSTQFQIPTPVRPTKLKEVSEAGVVGGWPDTQILPPQTGTAGLGGNTTLPYATTDDISSDREARCKFVDFE